jgi:DNA polymerase-3 subunit beta
MVGDTDGTIDMSMHENQLLVTIWQIKLYSRLLSGKFPDYTSFFPAEYNTKGVVLRTELIQSIKQTNLVARENHFNTRMRFHLEGNIEISTWDTEVGASTISVPGSVEGQSEIVGLNAQYLLDVLSVVQDDYTSLEFKNPLSPIVIRSVGGDDAARFRHIIMPLKI